MNKVIADNSRGFIERGHKPWISNESWTLVDERRQFKEELTTVDQNAFRTVKMSN